MNERGFEYDYEEVGDKKKNTVRWIHQPLVRQVAVSSCIWASYFQMGLFFGACPVLVAQLRREPLGNGTVIDDEAASWISSTGNFSAIPCVLLLGLMGECLGRKLPYLLICVTTCASFVLLFCSSSFTMLILAQILQGPLNGGSTTVCLMIASECVSPKHRGVFLTIKSATAFWAMWLANAIGTFFHWKTIAIIGMACAAYNTLIMTFCPESPFWLASKGKIRKCREAHRWLRGTDESAERELECLIKSEVERSRKEEGWGSLFTRLSFYFKKVLTIEFYQPLVLCILLAITYQFSGKLVISMYSIDIIKKITNNESVAYTGMSILDGITVLGMYVGCVVSRYTKRRSLFFSTEFLAILFLFLLSFYLYMIKLGLIKENVYLSISLLLAFSLSVSCGPMILITSLISEILPLDLRTLAAILQCIAANIIAAVSFKIAPWMFTKFGTHGAFLYFAVGSLVCSVILLKYLPETRNKTLVEIEISFKEKKISKDSKELL